MPPSVRELKLETVPEAERELDLLGFDPFSIRNFAPQMITRVLLVKNIPREEAEALRDEALAVRATAAVTGAGGAVAVVLGSTEKQLRKLCRSLAERPAPFPVLAESLQAALLGRMTPPREWATRTRLIDLTARPLVMGVLNVTPDSFSDGNRYFDTERAVARGIEMVSLGADIIDIGGESTRPFAEPVPEDEEIRRVLPVVEQLARQVSIPLSVDTYKAAVAARVVAAGAEIINDISGFAFDERMAEVVAEFGAGAVVMHTRGRPTVMQQRTGYTSLIEEIYESLEKGLERAELAGIPAGKLAVDPGIGFGKSREGNLEILRRLREFLSLGRPVLVGTSRKSFTGTTLGRATESRLFTTAATVAAAVAAGAAIIRVHDVQEMRDVADMAREIAFA